MAVAQVLACHELAEHVCRHLAPGPLLEEDPEIFKMKRRGLQRTLACVARVCRSLSDVALDVLWSVVDDIVQLLSILPAFVRTMSRVHTYKRYTFCREVTTEEWIRFQTYTYRVLELHAYHDGLSESAIDPSTWIILAQHCRGEPLLPRLRHLARFEINELGPAQVMLLTPGLRYLGIFICSSASTEMVGMVVDKALPFISEVNSLTIRFEESSEVDFHEEHPTHTGPIPFWTLNHLDSLKILHSFVLTSEILQTLANFPHLRSLTLQLSTMEFTPHTPLDYDFGALREISLRGPMNNLQQFLDVTRPRHIECLTLRPQIHTHFDVQSLHLVYSTLTSFGDSLCRLRIFFEAEYWMGSPTQHNPVLTARTMLAPLFSLNALREITFNLQNFLFRFPDEDFRALGTIWPNLTRFEFTVDAYDARNYIPNVPTTTSSPPSVQAIIDFALAHPHLERFRIPSLDPASIPEPTSLPVSDHGLQHLGITHIGPSDGTPILPIAIVLDRVFPHLRFPDNPRDYKYVPEVPARGRILEMLLFTLQIGRKGSHRM